MDSLRPISEQEQEKNKEHNSKAKEDWMKFELQKREATKDYLEKIDYIRNKGNELAYIAKMKGYISGNWIISDSFPNTKLRIGFGMIWSESQKALVVGCVDSENRYYTSVEIHRPKDDYWAELVSI